MEELAAVAAERADAAVLMGESGPELASLLESAGLRHLTAAGDLAEAVSKADAIARSLLVDDGSVPVTVLLSPAATSFDMFEDYAARGMAFKAAIAELAETRRRGTP